MGKTTSLRRWGFNLARDDVLGEGEDVVDGVLDLGAEEGVGGEARVAEPVVADHAALVGVGDGALLELPHGDEGPLHGRLHAAQELVGEAHAADVDEEAELLVLVEPVHVAVPELDRVLLDRVRGRERWGGGGVGGGGDGVGRAEAEVGRAQEELPPETEAAGGVAGRRRRAGD